MKFQMKRVTFIAYSLMLIVISALITVLFYHTFVFNSFSGNESQTKAFRELSEEQVKNSPVTEDNTIIEVMSLGCHYCAANEEKIERFARTLPPGSHFKTIHITSHDNGLALYAPVFATLEAMGIEAKYRDSAYNAILTRNIDLSDDAALNDWLAKSGIDREAYHKARQSNAVTERLNYMAAVTKYYGIRATPMFIINKRYVVAQDSNFPEFAERMRQLLVKGQ